ncbi:DNA cross-link repair 1A protein isoform X1 [Takifugu rubripes]|uniref:DNA cross-link repair 1A protein isoform X1 n=1 Tax=Takifugu rubripes TaxID=31033 RepID=UPI0011460E77|nr:DNA cross-link repair 1A protein isoform X1 [Takifugu rubripes]
MSQEDDSENEFWDYKPLKKKRNRLSARSYSSARSTADKVNTVQPADSRKCAAVDGAGRQNDSSTNSNGDEDAQDPSGDFCPICQMPFCILVMQTPRWHIAECLDLLRDTCEECSDGLRCFSTNPNHYKKFNHTLLAHSRANSSLSLPSQSEEGTGEKSAGPGLSISELKGFTLETSQESLSTLSNCSDSPQSSQTKTSSKITNGLQLLRSPGPEDFKKKKGWSSSAKRQKSVSSSQESKTHLSSTPLKAEREERTQHLLKCEASLNTKDSISYYPISEIPVEKEVRDSEFRKMLFNKDASVSEHEDSVERLSDFFSSEDELLAEFIDNMESNYVQAQAHAPLKIQLESVSSGLPTNQPIQQAASDFDEIGAGLMVKKEAPCSSTSLSKSIIQSPQSLVLERLRETIQGSVSLKDSLDSGGPHTSPPQLSSSESSQTMPPQKGHAKPGQASCLKQMDIGVFFGLKPLKESEKKVQSGPNELDASATLVMGETSGGQRQPRNNRQRRSKGEAPAGTSRGLGVNSLVDDQGELKNHRRRRWNRRNADGEVELPRCPFYKKIPGTKFAIDAFRYGMIEGITAYFLTHFHSDHYGGLTKSSTFPVYCNKITGNLVKSKLKVAEPYIHVLPMNTQVTVEGVTVVLLEANHCPGAAMLLFFLPDGQIVLHTGDFRADPSMELYPELLSCRVQTLYLDTTYCSPEYTFPTQQEVINFAASTAFELVALNPRTLVVCGSYSVGKEKVFFALADVLGSKVSLSRDKYNTMCCLESEQVKQCITTDWKAARVHVLPMMQLTFKKLEQHLARFSSQYDQLVAFKPTGWTFSQQVESVGEIEPDVSGNISIYGIPYSEHSSFVEMKRFVQWLQPLKIIPTVNNGSWESRRAMEKIFGEWLMEAKARR